MLLFWLYVVWLSRWIFASALQVEGGVGHTCALNLFGGVFCWGRGMEGQIGDGINSTSSRFSPTLVSGMQSGVTQIAVNGFHSCALLSGSIHCWGDNGNGQLGDGTRVNKYAPVLVSGMTRGVTAVTAGFNHTCIVKSSAVYCWGDNTYYQVGMNSSNHADSVTPYMTISSGIKTVVAGLYHTCAINTQNTVYCWGKDDFGQLGTGQASGMKFSPTVATNFMGSVQLAMGQAHSCSLDAESQLSCLGYNANGEVGDGTYETRLNSTYVEISSPSTVTSKLSHTCALASGLVYCWGNNLDGQVGDRNFPNVTRPQEVSGISGVTAISSGHYHQCAIVNNDVYCWGSNNNGQLANAQLSSSTPPTIISNFRLDQYPTYSPSVPPTFAPTTPTTPPTINPTKTPSRLPTYAPTPIPTQPPTFPPSRTPSRVPSFMPTYKPTSQPSSSPSSMPSHQPTSKPSSSPSSMPSHQPMSQPSSSPSSIPSHQPTSKPTSSPSSMPSHQPSSHPTSSPLSFPSYQPTSHPSSSPSSMPSYQPTSKPSSSPSSMPSTQPTSEPSSSPSSMPSHQPTSEPSSSPSSMPSTQPTSHPSSSPSSIPSMKPSVGIESSLVSELISRSNTSVALNESSSLVLFVSSVMSYSFSVAPALATNLRKFYFSESQLYTTSEIIAPWVSLSVTLIHFQDTVNKTEQLPPLMIPGSTSAISLSQPSVQEISQGQDVVLSVVSLSQNVLKQANAEFAINVSQSTSNNVISALANELSSDVISVQLLSENGTVYDQPVAFTATFTVNDEFYSGSTPNIETFTHDCVIGDKEIVTFHCSLSNVVLNLTCTGLTAASVSRSCPVPQRVCSVLSLTSLSVTNQEYCQAEVTDTEVICKCGYHRQDTPSNGTDIITDDNILDSNGVVSVAVMTQFVTGSFGGSAYKQSVLSPAEELVTESVAVFATFGSILFVGVLLLGGVVWNMDTSSSGKVDVKDVDSTAVSMSLHALVHEYIWSVVPMCFHAMDSWPNRLASIIRRNHPYVRVVTILRAMFIAKEDNPEYKSSLAQRKVILDIVQIITTFVTSCAILALVFDLQYPSDDGSCDAHTSRSACLLRRTPLDVSQSYCLWQEYVPPSAGKLSEIIVATTGLRQLLQEVTLEAALLPSIDVVQCSYNTAPKSVSATVLALIISSLCALPLNLLLSFVMAMIRSKPLQDLQNRRIASKVVPVKATTSNVDTSLYAIGLVPQQQQQRVSGTRAIALSRRYWTSMKKTLVSWYDETIVLTPELPYDVKVKRARLLHYLSKPVFPVDMQVKERYTQQQSLTTHPISSPIHTDITPVLSVNTTQWMTMHRKLRDANDAEFAMVLLQTWLSEISVVSPTAVSETHPLRHTLTQSATNMIPIHIARQYPTEAYATDTTRVLSMVLIALLNVGSLYFIALRGAFRGFGWQVQFLSVCLLNWISETLFLRMCDIVVLDVCLPSWVMQEVLGQVEQMKRAFEVTVTDGQGRRLLSGDGDTQRHRDTSHDHTKPAVSHLSKYMATRRPQLLESQVVLSSVVCVADVSSEDVSRPLLGVAPPAQQRFKEVQEAVVSWLCRSPHWQQYLLMRLVSSSVLACVVYLWYGLRQRRETLTTSGFVSALLVCVAGCVVYAGHRQRSETQLSPIETQTTVSPSPVIVSGDTLSIAHPYVSHDTPPPVSQIALKPTAYPTCVAEDTRDTNNNNNNNNNKSKTLFSSEGDSFSLDSDFCSVSDDSYDNDEEDGKRNDSLDRHVHKTPLNYSNKHYSNTFSVPTDRHTASEHSDSSGTNVNTNSSFDSYSDDDGV